MSLRVLMLKALQTQIEHQLEAVLDDLNYTEYLILQTVVHSGKDVKPKDISRKILISDAGMTGYLDQLTQKKYLSRKENSRDRRSYIIELMNPSLIAQKISLIEEKEEAIFKEIFEWANVDAITAAINRALSTK